MLAGGGDVCEGGDVRKVAGGFRVLGLLLSEESRHGDDVGIDVLLPDRRSAVTVCRHDGRVVGWVIRLGVGEERPWTTEGRSRRSIYSCPTSVQRGRLKLKETSCINGRSGSIHP